MRPRHTTTALAFAVALAASVHAQTIIHVDGNSPNDGPGIERDHAYRCVQDALTAAVAGDEIRVAPGTHRPDENTANPAGTGNCEATFQLVSDVATYEGYTGHGATEPDERIIADFVTILSADQIDNDVALSDIA